MDNIKMPIGIEWFEDIRTGGYYYVDKTEILSELLRRTYVVNLITRPRRFGKTLLMDTIYNFIDISKDNSGLFDGLKISKDKEICEKWQNKWPVIFLSFKEIKDITFEGAYEKLAICFSDLYIKYRNLLEESNVVSYDKDFFDKICAKKASQPELQNAIYVLMRMLKEHYGKRVVLLMDEYDVPLASANENGYYMEMLNVIMGIMNKTLKSNPIMEFAIVTGCLRVAKESVFTGVNNFVSFSISDNRYSEYIGFTEEDVQKILMDAGLEEYADKIKKWYDGYQFGNIEIYCPWDVINYVNDILENATVDPKNYWENTSHNGIIRTFINMANDGTQLEWDINDDFETLLAGGYVEKMIDENINYDTLYSSENNLWSLLYLTGYLTKVKDSTIQNGYVALKIPNEEIKHIFGKTVVSWFNDHVITIDRSELFAALWEGDDNKATDIISDLLFDTIGYYDYKEDYYHAFLAGILVGGGYAVKSNTQKGLGRPDIVMTDRKNRRVMIIEAKRASNEDNLEKECQNALAQIEEKKYAEEYKKKYKTIVCLGIAFYEKECLVKRL